jgi:hypothetical protein
MLELLEFNQQLATILMQKPNQIMPLFSGFPERMQPLPHGQIARELPRAHQTRAHVHSPRAAQRAPVSAQCT